MGFFDLVFWQGFVSNAAATLLGVAVGIPVALYLDRLFSGRQESKEAKKKRAGLAQRQSQFLSMLCETLQKNLALIEQMEQEVRPERLIFYNVDIQLLESTSSIKHEIIDDLDLVRQLDSIRYELLHLHRKVELQLEIQYSSYRALGDYMERRTQLIESITQHLPRIKQELADTISIISAKLPERA